MKTWIQTIVVLLAVQFAGCVAPPRDISKFAGEIRYTPEDAVAVRLSEADARRQDDMRSVFGDRHPMITGTIWSRVFVGFASDQPSLSITSATFKEMPEVIGFTTRYTYTAQIVLHFQGHDFPITATGSRASGMMMQSAMRQSVELAVIDAARQAKAIIAANAST